LSLFIRSMHPLFIISDGTGRTADQIVKAALTQFEGREVVVNVRPNINTENEILSVVKEAKLVEGIIVHTVVSKKLRNKILKFSKLYNVESIDIMGPLLAQLSNVLEIKPIEKPGLYHKLNKAYFQRIEAIEFAFRHDNGQKTDEFDKAEIILLGVSRTFKTPLSIYLANKGWLVANVQITKGIAFPEILVGLSPEKVFCLTTYATKLIQLRSYRDEHLGGIVGNYVDFKSVQQELNYANSIFQLHPEWELINVADKPLEEIASEILEIIKKRKELKQK
jgi:[pyruvate, water dikinase]-phosphate phosphotransferase / [pyruvate, water dikinase] kinase